MSLCWNDELSTKTLRVARSWSGKKARARYGWLKTWLTSNTTFSLFSSQLASSSGTCTKLTLAAVSQPLSVAAVSASMT